MALVFTFYFMGGLLKYFLLVLKPYRSNILEQQSGLVITSLDYHNVV